MNDWRPRFGFLFALVIACALASGAADAQPFPARPIRIILPYPPGSFTDSLPRMLAEKLKNEWGQPVIIDNRPGAAGRIAADFVARAPADGYTLLAAGPDQITIAPHLYRNVRYATGDFAPVSLMWRQTLVFVVRQDLPAKNVVDVVAAAKARPGTMSWASWGEGSLGHLSLEHFKSVSGTDIMHVPFAGSLAGTTAVASGNVDMMITGYATARALIDAGKVRLMARAGTTRSRDAPDLPTIAEAGYAGYEAVTWNGLVAPKRTPKAIVDAISAAVVKALSSPDIREKTTAAYADVAGSTAEEFGKLIQADELQWEKTIRDAKLQLE